MIAGAVATNAWTVAAMGGFAYLLGGIPIGLLMARSRDPDLDPRDWGSGNVGTSNIYRNVDQGVAVVVGPAQFLQGLAPVLLARALGFPTWVLALTAVCAVIGNGWPVWLGFNGGRGIAVATGAVAATSLLGLGILLACYAAGALGRRIAVGVLCGFAALVLVGALGFFGPDAELTWIALLAIILLRRLEGVVADARQSDRPIAMTVRRLAFDQRPGRPLVGRRTDRQPEA